MTELKLNHGHPEDRKLYSLELVEHSVQAQLEFEHLITLRNKNEIDLAQCFPNGKLILRGHTCGYFQTIDPEVARTYLVQDGKRKAILYINHLRKTCVAIDWLY